MSRKTKRFLPRLRRWRQKARWARRKLAGVPRMVRITGVVAILLAVVGLTNIVYQVIHKPTELFAFVGHGLDKEPTETWRQYGALFRTYSTGTIPPELLAALAQGAHFADGERRFHTMVSSRFNRHGDWFRGLCWRQEFDCGRSAFACFLR